MRECSKCKRSLSIDEYKWILRRGKRVLNTQCNECVAAYKRAHYEKNREKYLEDARRQRERDPKGYAEYMRKYQQENRAELARKARERNRRPEVRERINERFREYRKDPEFLARERARGILNKRVHSGKIVKPDRCEACKRKGYVEAHHDDYDKPLEVAWVCKSCHEYIHHSNEGRIS